jgi:hypothetical protein
MQYVGYEGNKRVSGLIYNLISNVSLPYEFTAKFFFCVYRYTMVPSKRLIFAWYNMAGRECWSSVVMRG